MEAQGTSEMSAPPQAVLLQMAMGGMISQAIGVVAELGIADLLNKGPKPISDLAASAGAHERSLYRILRSLASVGIFTEEGKGTFSNTPLSEAMRSDAPGSMRSMMRFIARPWHFAAWGNMVDSARTGRTTCEKTLGAEIFDWFAANPDESEIFNDAMTSMSGIAAMSVIGAYDFTGISTVADIAGGHGFLLSQILKANPALTGILFDLEHVVAGAGPLLAEHGVADRVTIASGDFFKEVPSADAYIMKHIIHDWDDDKAVLILESIHRAMIGEGKLLLVEMVIPEGNDPHPGKILDLEMLTLPGGLERTEAEYAELFDQAGFRLNRVVSTLSPFSVIEGVKA